MFLSLAKLCTAVAARGVYLVGADGGVINFKSAGPFLSSQKGEFKGDVHKNIDNLNMANPWTIPHILWQLKNF